MLSRTRIASRVVCIGRGEEWGGVSFRRGALVCDRRVCVPVSARYVGISTCTIRGARYGARDMGRAIRDARYGARDTGRAIQNMNRQ